MTTFNLRSTLNNLEAKQNFITSAVFSVEKQISLIAETEKVIASLALVQNIDGLAVDMWQMAGNIIERAGKRLTISDKAVFAFFNVQLNEAKTVTKDLVAELFYAKKARLEADAESRKLLEVQLDDQKKLLLTISTNISLAKNETATVLESLPEQIAGVLHRETRDVYAVFGVTPVVEHADILSRVEGAAFKFNIKDGKRVNLTVSKEVLEKVANMLDEIKVLKAAHSGMSAGQREALFSGFNKLNNSLKLFKEGEFPTAQGTPVQAPKGFSGTEAAHAVPRAPVFNSIASFFKLIDSSLVVSCTDGIDVINKLVQTANENRGWSILKSVKVYQKSQQAELIEKIDNFDIVLQGYLTVAMQQFIKEGVTSQLDRLVKSPTMVNNGQLTPYGRQVKGYIACVLPYVTLKHRGDGVERFYYFEPVKFNRFSKLEISEIPGFYAFGVRSKSVKDGQQIDARLPVICIRAHYYITKLLRELKRANDKEIKEAHAREWADYRLKYGKEYDRRTLQDEIDALSAALTAKTKDLANLG